MRRCALLILLLLSLPHARASGAPHPRVVVVVAGSASIRDFAAMPALFRNGSAALLNVRVGRPSHDAEPGSKSGFETGCLSLGTSAMATGGAEIRRAGDAGGVIDGLGVTDTYVARTNLQPGHARILHTEIARMQRLNLAASYRAKPGELGSALHAEGIRTAVIGSSDIPGEIHREAVAIAMDENGVVDYGEVDGTQLNLRDPSAPYGIRTNPKALLSALDGLPKDCRFVVIDFGDTFRADSYAELCSNEQAAAIKGLADSRLGDFVGEVASRLDRTRDLLIVLSPNSRSFTEIEGERMAAIVISGPGFGRGMLGSPSTRRPGLVTLADVAPTILSFLGIKPGADMVGRPVSSLGGANASQALIETNLAASGQAARQGVMRWASVTQSVIVVLVLAAILLTGSASVKRIAAWIVPSVVAIPLAMLILPLVYSGGTVVSVALLVLIVIAILGACALVLRSPSRSFVRLCGAVVVALAVDLLRGGPVIGSSIAAYSIVEGARYYGIGNELMGTMLGAALVGVGMALEGSKAHSRAAWVFAAVVFGAVFVFIGAPMLGANVGGALAVAPAAAVALLAMRGWRPSGRGIALIALITVLAVGGLFAVDALRGGAAQSHAGRTVGMLTGGDATGILSVFERKLALNFMLVATSVWSRLLGLCLAGSALLFWWGRRTGKPLGHYESAAALGCLVGTVAAFIFNDSGVVAGATCAVLLWALLALRLLVEREA